MRRIAIVGLLLLMASVLALADGVGSVTVEPWHFTSEERSIQQMWLDGSGAFRFTVSTSHPNQRRLSYTVWIEHYHPDHGLTPYATIPLVEMTSVGGAHIEGCEINGIFSLSITHTKDFEATLTFSLSLGSSYRRTSCLLPHPTSSGDDSLVSPLQATSWKVLEWVRPDLLRAKVGTPIPIASATFTPSGGTPISTTELFSERVIELAISYGNHFYVVYVAFDVEKQDEVRIVHLTSPVTAGQRAKITLQGLPNTSYAISVSHHDFYFDDKAHGLDPATSDDLGLVSWEWITPVRIASGSYQIVIRDFDRSENVLETTYFVRSTLPAQIQEKLFPEAFDSNK